MTGQICGYWKMRWRHIAFYIAMMGLLALVLFLYRVDTDVIVYAVTLLLMAGALFSFCDGILYLRHAYLVRHALDGIPEELREFPMAQDATELFYQKKMQQLYRDFEKQELDMRIGKQDMLDYYSLWVHQIKTPIAAMHLLLQTAENNDLYYLEELAGEQFLRDMKMELFRTEQYVEMVLSYLCMGDMSKDLALQEYSLDAIIRQAVRKYSPLFIMKKIRLKYETCDRRVLTDEKWLQFVLEQLLSNALKYTYEGSIHIYQENTKLVIADTGIGIQQEDLPRIFEKGFTGYNGRQDKKSTGLGLYLCKTICDRLNHRIWAVSEPGKGTKLYLELNRQKLEMLE